MGHIIDRPRLDPTDDSLLPPLLTHASTDGLLRFEYREDAPGVLPAQVSEYTTFIIPVQETPLRVIGQRDGRSEQFTMKGGDIAVALAGSLNAWQWLDPTKVILLHIDPDVMRRFVQTELKVIPTGHRFENTIFFRDAEVRNGAERMRETLVAGELGAGVVFDALARMFLVQLVKRYGKAEQSDMSFDQRFGPDQYAQVVRYIEDHLDQKLNPAQLAAELGMSEAAFARKFKARVGETPMRFVNKIRLEVARRLLGKGTLAIAQIAADCGFADQAHMSRSFKRHLGMSPSEFRAGHA